MEQDLRDIIVGGCSKCFGSGIYEDDDCSCIKEYRILISMQNGGFPASIISQIHRGSLRKTFDLDNKEDPSVTYYNTVSSKVGSVECGLSLVLHGSGLLEAASLIVYRVLLEDYRISCGYNQHPATLCVFDLSCPNLKEILKKREKQLKPSFLLLESTLTLDSDFELSDILGWDGEDFTGKVYRGCSVRETSEGGRW